MELHGPGATHPKWGSPPTRNGSGVDALAQHLLLLDFDDGDDGAVSHESSQMNGHAVAGSSPSDSPGAFSHHMAAAAAAAAAAVAGGSPVDARMARHQTAAPVAPSGFTPAEVRAGRGFEGRGGRAGATDPPFRPPVQKFSVQSHPNHQRAVSHPPSPQPTDCMYAAQTLNLTSFTPRPHSPPKQAYVDRQDRTVFFAKCAPSASVDAVARVFGAWGQVSEINLFRAWCVYLHASGGVATRQRQFLGAGGGRGGPARG
jgi:hypothetical protein